METVNGKKNGDTSVWNMLVRNPQCEIVNRVVVSKQQLCLRNTNMNNSNEGICGAIT